jgi:hypothetical protein
MESPVTGSNPENLPKKGILPKVGKKAPGKHFMTMEKLKPKKPLKEAKGPENVYTIIAMER